VTRIPASGHDADASALLPGVRIVDASGRQARIVSVLQADAEPTAVIRIEQGPEVVLPISLLTPRQDGAYGLPFGFDALSNNTGNQQETVIPVWHEELQIGKRIVDTGKGVRVHKTVSAREQIVDQPLLHDELVVEHVPVGQMVTAAQLPATRYDGDTLIVPILEEVLVVEKKMRLKEEVRITRRRHEIHVPQTVLLKSEQVSVEHFDERIDAAHRDSIPASSASVEPDFGKPAG
jgi:uncharacterized protein (TIGR02271 family)